MVAKGGILLKMHTVRIESSFAAAHFLSHYHGKCERLHGHNYKVRLWAKGKDLDSGGMLVDFGEMKKALAAVTETLDHSNLNDNPVFAGDPSAERIARHIYAEVRKAQPQAPFYRVDVFETEVNMASYEAD